MALYDDRLRQNFIGLDKGAEQYRDLMFDAFGVTPEAREYILANNTVAWEDEPPFEGHPEKRVRGFYWDGQAVIPRPQQTEGSLHELAHGWWKKQRQEPNVAYVLAYQIAVYAIAGPEASTPQFHEFAKGYYYGIGDWPGMYVKDGKRTELQQARWWDFLCPNRRRLDMDLVLDEELFAGPCSWTMGQFKTGIRRLPQSMWWIFNEFFTGEILATPRYEGGVP